MAGSSDLWWGSWVKPLGGEENTESAVEVLRAGSRFAGICESWDLHATSRAMPTLSRLRVQPLAHLALSPFLKATVRIWHEDVEVRALHSS